MQKIRWHFNIPAKARRRLLIGGGAFLVLFAVANIGVGLAYHDRTYPSTVVMGKNVGNVAYRDLSDTVRQAKLVPDSVQLVHGDKKVSVTPAQLGLEIDPDMARQNAQKQRSWLPLFDLLGRTQLEAPFRLQEQTWAKLKDELVQQFKRNAKNAHLTLNGATVGVVGAEDGYELDGTLLERSLLDQLGDGKAVIDVPTKTIAPKVTEGDLADDKSELSARLATPVSYKYQDKSRQVKAEEVAGWYQQQGETYQLSDEKLQAFLSGAGSEFNIRIKDVAGAANATKLGLESKKATTVTLTKLPPARTFTYCTAVEGVSGSYLAALRSQVQNTFTHPQGWSMTGLVEFKEVLTGCDFTVWLAAADSVPTFGDACDNVWSCRVGSNVIINFDRWQQASPAWQAYGGTIEDYRHLAINHEVGHWFGFGHSECTGAGHKASVMMQQSMNLGGCVFNPWPIPSELQALRSSLGL